jgi:hypothetical protein
MSFTFRLIAGALLLLITASCATTENAGDTASETDEQAETDRVERTAPEWFSSTVSSERDGSDFHGYSHAVGGDRAEASRLSFEMASANLRFEIDRYAENVRANLEEEIGTDPYATSRFIITLRNAIQDMDLSGLDDETEFNDDGAIDSFTRLSISVERAADKLAEKLDDDRFISAFRERASR